MIGIVVITHGQLSKSMIETVKIFNNNLANVGYLSLEVGSEVDSFEKSIIDLYDRHNEGEGVLFLTDIFGGTPSNIVWKLQMNNYNLECVTGLNLGMVLEVLMARQSNDLFDLATIALEAGIEGIKKLEVKE